MPPASLNLDVPVRPSAKEIAASLPFLPASPNVLPRLAELIQGGSLNLRELAALIRLDPGLTARTLQAGIPMAAARGTACAALDDAVDVLGQPYLTGMISRVAKAQVFSLPVALYGLDADDYWRWSVSCALAAELLAGETGEDPDVAYEAGLLHATGMAAIDEWARGNAPALLFMPRDSTHDFSGSEVALFGCTQAEIGAAVLQMWKLPANIVDPIRHQNDPLNATGSARMASLLNAATWLRSVVCLDDAFRTPPAPKAEILSLLRLSAHTLSRLVVDLRIRLGRIRNRIEPVAA